MPSGFDVKSKAAGLYNNNNEFIVPDGALSVADNAFISRDNVIERRPGFDNCSDFLPNAKPLQMFSFNGHLYVNINDQLWVQNGDCTYTQILGIGPSIFAPTALFADSTALYIGTPTILAKYIFATNELQFMAGLEGTTGSTDGVGGAARFNGILGIWGDGTNLYICDNVNVIIRQVVISSNTVSTVAGTAGMAGSVDAAGAAARFRGPNGIWGDGTNLWVCDKSNQTIRKIVIAGFNVTTICGTALATGFVNAVGAAARFDDPMGIWGSGTTLWVADSNNSALRKIDTTTNGVTTFLLLTQDSHGVPYQPFPEQVWADATYVYFTAMNYPLSTETQLCKVLFNGTFDEIFYSASWGVSAETVSMRGFGSFIYLGFSGENKIDEYDLINNNAYILINGDDILTTKTVYGYSLINIQGPY